MKLPCISCGVSLRVADNTAGKHVRCPKCAATNVVPESALTSGTALSKAAAGFQQADAEPHGTDEILSALQSTYKVNLDAHQEQHAESQDPVPYSTPRTMHSVSAATPKNYLSDVPPSAPRYRAVEIIGRLLEILGYIAIVIAAVVLIGGIVVGLFLGYQNGSSFGERASIFVSTVVVSLLWSLAMAFYGIVLIFWGQIVLCMRDLTRNSFWLKHIYSSVHQLAERR